ncbi:FtsK/SpoIIIE domain-containing protein [Allonocardiopsis opalescens]|uniref:S-DNA-T family DNA segregation ATPase FtsK/SpoIIIE n=1 Tax=Allonocardiopsis opalescens TaxID=1144618 RepID=A0A2T0Q368_9ACTN|nr:FtsK/SpoIIIE domain-containing protein [Allonocardiopsis opalescens]PRX98170.1 S-DNA-T family DNA segregation ATPase FtsK/SpoIIIE [Allonocardiopsis opalescens]
MKRRRRWGRRRDAEPLLIMTDDGYPGEVLVLVGRWLFRYRSELGPVALAAALFVAGWGLHGSYRAWWPAVAVASVLTAAGILASGRAWLDRAEERGYAAAVTASAGGWLTAATYLGPGTEPLPLLLLVGVVVSGLPWWRHRRRRARVHVERTIAAWPDLGETIGLPGSRMLSAVVDRWGWRARVALRRGQSFADVVDRVPAIESGLGTRPGAVRVEPDPHRADRFALRVLAADPHARPVPWPGRPASGAAEPLALGVFEDADPVRVPLLRRHALIGGIAGSGKSGVLNVVLAHLTACLDVVVWGVDLKGGMELAPWRACLDRLATTPAEAAALLRDATGVLDARAARLGTTGTRVWEPTPDAPALVIVVDEYAELAEEAPAATGHADSIARRGRAVAVTLIAATQRPTQAAMGRGAVRSQMDVRVCLRVRERRDTDLVLGQGMHAAGWHAHTLDEPGKFLVSAPGFDSPRRARAYLLTDDQIRTLAHAHTERRPPLDALSADAVRRTAPLTSGAPHDAVDTDPADDPESRLSDALADAPPDGRSVADLMDATGMGRTWVYDRLQQLADTGRVVQVARGRWRGTDPT